MYEVVTGYELFDDGTSRLFHTMATMAGSVPFGWKEWWDAQSNQCAISPSVAVAWWEKRRNSFCRHFSDLEDADAFFSLLRRMLILDPAARPTASEILQDPWFLSTVTSMESLKTIPSGVSQACPHRDGNDVE